MSKDYYDTAVIPNWTEEERLAFLFQKPEKVEKENVPERVVPLQPSIFSPKTFTEYIGQEDAKRLAQIMVLAAKKEKRPLPNILIVGGFGLGKTSLAQVIIREYKGLVTSSDIKDGMTVNKEKPSSGTIIIDEIHLLDPAVADKLNIAIDTGSLHIIGCTTDPGKLPAAFRSRFRLLTLNSYSVQDLSTIAREICNRKKITCSTFVLDYIAYRSRFNARQVTTYLSMMFDILAIKERNILSQEIADEAFNLLGVDQFGFLQRDRDYLKAMPDRPIGLSALSALIGIDPVTIESEIEPFLLQNGLIDRTPKGRVKLGDIR